jgi:hypothetical protein
LLASADLWLFVATANRCADAVPWRLLEIAAARPASCSTAYRERLSMKCSPT